MNNKFLNALLAIVVCHSVKSAIFIDSLYFKRSGNCYEQVYYFHAKYVTLCFSDHAMSHLRGHH